MASMLYSLVRVVLDAIATSHSNEAKLRVDVLALRRQVQVLERQIKRVRWEPGDRMILAALRERLPRSAWAALLVQPETVLGWHRELVRRRWLKRSESLSSEWRTRIHAGDTSVSGASCSSLASRSRRPRFGPCFAPATSRLPAADRR